MFHDEGKLDGLFQVDDRPSDPTSFINSSENVKADNRSVSLNSIEMEDTGSPSGDGQRVETSPTSDRHLLAEEIVNELLEDMAEEELEYLLGSVIQRQIC